MIFARNGYGGVSANWQAVAGGAFTPQWTDLGNQITTYPSATTDAYSRQVLSIVGTDGRLYLRTEYGPPGFFGFWTQVGN
jgi:hypothetical protein